MVAALGFLPLAHGASRGASDKSPPAAAPLRDGGALGADGGVAAVAGTDSGGVGVDGEYSLRRILQRGVEAGWVLLGHSVKVLNVTI